MICAEIAYAKRVQCSALAQHRVAQHTELAGVVVQDDLIADGGGGARRERVQRAHHHRQRLVEQHQKHREDGTGDVIDWPRQLRRALVVQILASLKIRSIREFKRKEIKKYQIN